MNMSLKSQNSINDDFADTFEGSYSARSLSDESLSSENDDEYLSKELLRKLTPAVLGKLRKCFKKAKEKRVKDLDKKVEEVMRQAAAEEGIEFAVPARANHEDQVYLNETGFVSAVDDILGDRKYSVHARTLYRALDRLRSGRVSWSQLLARLVASGARVTASRGDDWIPATEGGVVKLEHCKRETIVSLVSIEADGCFTFVAVSRGGRAGVCSGDLQLIHSYEVQSAGGHML